MLTGLDLTFMGVTWSNSGLSQHSRFCCLTCGKKEWGEERKKKKEKKRREGGKKEIEKEERKGGGKKE